VIRAALAVVLNEKMGGRGGPTPGALILRHWPKDSTAYALATRAATAPAQTGVAGWAQELSPTNVAADFVMGLARQSGAARLIAAGLRPSLEGVQTLKIPYATGQAAQEPLFVDEGGVIPVSQSDFATTPLGPACKLAMIQAVSDELLQHSIPSAELIIRALASEGCARSLDKAIFSATAGSASRPAGILFGVTPIAAAANSGQTLNVEAAATDIANLISAITDAGGGKQVMIFMAPGKAIALAMVALGLALVRELGGEIVGVPTMPNNQLIAVDPQGFASAFDPTPITEASNQVSVVLDNSAPTDIGTPGAPATVGAPAKSKFQIQATALKITLPCAFTMRCPGLVQTITAVNW
jgi:hypothetical protein